MSVRARLDSLLSRRIAVLDGAMGTMIQRLRLDESAFRGERFTTHPLDLRGDNDVLVLTQPGAIRSIHDAYLEAGADVIETNTFNSNTISQSDYGLSDRVYELNAEGARLAREAADAWTARTPERARFVAGSIGPTDRMLSTTRGVDRRTAGGVTFDEMKAAYVDQIRGLVDGGVDLLLIETIVDASGAKAVIAARDDVLAASGRDVPLMLSVTLTERGRTFTGQTLDEFCATVEDARPWSIGINCAFGARGLRPHLAELSRIADAWISVCPNAGLPNALGEYDQGPDEMAVLLGDFVASGFADIVGGCCGTTPEHVARAVRAIDGVTPRRHRHTRS
jgi:5-methyltetrahydrofolate--homocysteine methyltransferase